VSEVLSDQERACLEKLAAEPLWTSSAWWTNGLTEMLRQMQERGLVGCRDRDHRPADPLDIDDGAHWHITDAGRFALNAS
jgi:hypothetical protein